MPRAASHAVAPPPGPPGYPGLADLQPAGNAGLHYPQPPGFQPPSGQAFGYPQAGPIAASAPQGLSGIMSNAMSVEDMLSGGSSPLDDPLHKAFVGPAIDLMVSEVAPRIVTDPVAQRRPEAARPAHGEAETPEVTRSRALAAIARYGAKPKRPIEAGSYFWRVLLRRRELEVELSALRAQRKRLEHATDDAACALGEALYALRDDARLAPIQAELAAVAQAEQQLGARKAESEKADAQRKDELLRIAQEIGRVEAEAAPLRAREAELRAKEDAERASLQAAEQGLRKADAELHKLRGAKEPAPPERIAVAEAERAAKESEARVISAKLEPLQQELVAVRKDLAARMSTIGGLRDEEAAVNRAMEAEIDRLRASASTAQNAYRSAACALAAAAQRAGVAMLAPKEDAALAEAVEREAQKRQAEVQHRAAVSTYDETAYALGKRIALGSLAALAVLAAVALTVL